MTPVPATTQIDVSRFEHRPVMPLYVSGAENRFNLDGLVFYRPASDLHPSPTYVQLFRNGAIEAVEARLLHVPERTVKSFATIRWEEELIEKLTDYLAVLREYGLDPPIFIMVTLLGVKGYSIACGPFRDTKGPIDRDALLLPDVLVEDYSASAAHILRPVFDAVWQASGWPRCPHYDERGEHRGA